MGLDIFEGTKQDLQNVDFGTLAEADFNAACDLALNTAIPSSNTSNSINDVLLDVLKPSTARVLCTPATFWSAVQLGLTVPIVGSAATLTLPSVTIASIPTGATIVYARPFMISRIIKNTAATTNKLSGATVAATSQVIQIKKDSGSWVDAITFIDDQFSQDGYAIEGGALVIDATNMASTITGNGVYTFQWLLAGADAASIYFQGVKMGIQLSYSI